MRIIGNEINIQLNGTTISYTDLGEGEIPIIFVHGFPFDKSFWEPQMEFFKQTHRVISYDVRGFGNSGLGEQKFSMRLFADDLIMLMDKLYIKKAIVCGLSMGGYILINAAYRYSERISAIILSDTQCNPESTKMRKERAITTAQINSEGLKIFTENHLNTIFSPESMDKKKELIEQIRNVIVSTSPLAITATLDALALHYQMCPSLKEITVPTLILCGKDDKKKPLPQSEYLLKSITNPIMQNIEKAGHLPNLEQPEEFNKHLSNFIARIA